METFSKNLGSNLKLLGSGRVIRTKVHTVDTKVLSPTCTILSLRRPSPRNLYTPALAWTVRLQAIQQFHLSFFFPLPYFVTSAVTHILQYCLCEITPFRSGFVLSHCAEITYCSVSCPQTPHKDPRLRITNSIHHTTCNLKLTELLLCTFTLCTWYTAVLGSWPGLTCARINSDVNTLKRVKQNRLYQQPIQM